MTDSIILVWLIAIPFIGGLLSWIGELAGGITYPRWIALGTMGLAFAMSLWLWLGGDYTIAAGIGAKATWALEFRAPWIERFGISIHLGLDGLSMLLIVLTNLLGLMAVACSWKEIGRYVGFFHLNLLWNLGGVVAVFLALDLFLFFFFWEMMLVPMYFLIAIWGHNAPGGKGRIYVLMIAILLGLGDPFVCNPLKHYIERPRPFVTLPDARQPGKIAPDNESFGVPASAGPSTDTNAPDRLKPGLQTGTQSEAQRTATTPRALNSFPSAHAFNWGALALITFIYYRRSWRFMVPLALAVAYSRIYNGVHYPSDVLVGLLLGATYGFSGVVTLNALWGSLGKKLFPAAHRRLPTLRVP